MRTAKASASPQARKRGARLSACVILAASAALLLAAGLMQIRTPVQAYAETGTTAGSGAVVETPSGTEIYSNGLFSDMAGKVETGKIEVGEQYVLSGDFHGGWGTVEFDWHSVDGDEVSQLVEKGPTADSALDWKQVSSVTVKGSLPQLNQAVVQGGKSQTFAVAGISPGLSAWRLTATDEIGDTGSIWWVIEVQAASGDSGSSGSGSSSSSSSTSASTGPNSADSDSDSEARATANASPSQTVVVNQSSGASDQQIAGKGGLPLTGDELDLLIQIVITVAAIAAVVAMTAGISALRKRRN